MPNIGALIKAAAKLADQAAEAIDRGLRSASGKPQPIPIPIPARPQRPRRR